MRSLGYSTVLPGVRWCEQPFFHLIEGILSPDFNFKDAIETHSSGLLKDFQKLSFVSAKTARSLKDTLIVLPSFSPCCAQHFSHLAPRSRIGLALVLSVVRVAFRGASTEDDNDWLQIQTHISWTGHAKKKKIQKKNSLWLKMGIYSRVLLLSKFVLICMQRQTTISPDFL